MNHLAVSRAPKVIWREPLPWWFAAVVTLGLLGVAYSEGLAPLATTWSESEEYSYGYLIPALTAYFIWQKRDDLKQLEFAGSWGGLALLLAGLALLVVGNLSTLYIIIQYGFLVAIVGTVLAFVGVPAFRLIWAPLVILAFMIPLPNFLYQGLSANLQLISSDLGVALIRLFGISVTSEGNVIDLGSFRLQVVEACSGLRYLFPLMTFGFIAAYLFKAPLWQRAAVFFSTIPITVLMNSVRIGIIGVTVEYWGPRMAEGFLHDFEGWFVFMACTAVLFAEMWLLTRATQRDVPFRRVFGIAACAPIALPADIRDRAVPRPLWLAIAMLALVAGYSKGKAERIEVVPPRAEFVEFPLTIGEWRGVGERLDRIYVDALKFDDYIMANYADRNGGSPINFYSAYYASQRKGQSAHSPRSCIPGDGWRIEGHDVKIVDAVAAGGKGFAVNRVSIRKGEQRQLVYYWFQQRGRVITNEYLVKWYIFLDALTRNRSDGALVRLSVPVPPTVELDRVDAELENFVRVVSPLLPRYIPD